MNSKAITLVPYTITPIIGNPNGPFVDVVLDLETLGTKPGCKILSIGAVMFNIPEGFLQEGEKPAEFYCAVSVNAQGTLEADPATIAWWNKQSPEAYAAAFCGTYPLQNVLREFNTWLELCSNWGQYVVRIWGKGKDFDGPILRAAYKAVGMIHNWDAEFEMCFRHLYEDMKNKVGVHVFRGEKHNALADALNQAAYADVVIDYFKAHGIYEEKMHEYKWTLPYGEKLR